MSWYDVYDNVEIQLVTRRKAAALTAITVVALAGALLLAVVGFTGRLPFFPVLLVSMSAGGGFLWWFTRRLGRLRRIVWCVKLSREEIVGYDYARRRRALAWRKVERVEIGDSGLAIVGPQTLQLEIAHIFREFPQVSHRITRYADRYGIPIFINGKPWQHINVYELYPFLADDSSPRRGSAAF